MDIPLSKVCWRSVTVQCVFYPFCTEVKRTESFNRRLVANCDIIMTLFQPAPLFDWREIQGGFYFRSRFTINTRPRGGTVQGSRRIVL